MKLRCSNIRDVLEPLPEGDAKQLAVTASEVRAALKIGAAERAAAERVIRGRRTGMR